jgi:predicted CXXCH cytochrome family protein
MSQEFRTKNINRLPVTALLTLFGLPLILQQQAAGQTVTEHPYIAPAEIKSETCLGCHPDKKEGKFVHTGVTSGCESCHQATSEKEKERTTITLMAQGGELCAMCHETEKDVAVHKPYQLGQCLVCHDAHTGAFKAQLRADVNPLCLACHGVNQPNVNVNQEGRAVSLFSTRTVPLDEYRQAPKIPLDRAGMRGHPMMNHPVVGKNVPGKADSITCLSCHAHHCSPEEKLIRPVANSQIGICGTCHE